MYLKQQRTLRKSRKGEIPLLELLEKHPVRETLSTDSDTFQYTITPQLVQHKLCSDLASLVEKRKQMLSLSGMCYQWSSYLYNLLLIWYKFWWLVEAWFNR